MMNSFFGNASQRCLSAANAVIVGDSATVYKNFMTNVIDRSSRIKVDCGLDKSIQAGPVRDKKKKENILRYIENRYKG